ncbi:hypothetical protein HS961_11045 [Comamonas piscis]|uniref:IPTL-CTERM sorting domain-containing protein n=1 Tax=Comamonas piscis TaxID=1562974 RepID=A0A7G5EH47_9BURK|nr:hypothetical protein [Comamonas piscis]QMV73322.1 hypothetical protein HS961_11045 [Comamonas piscis]WSO36122.1 hypothetical protein VUJ63_11080 [Comamonas piscis]
MKISPIQQLAACTLVSALMAAPMAHADIRESFTGTTASGWILADDSSLTAPSVDADGQRWLRLNGLQNGQVGRALWTGISQPIVANTPLYFEFEYVSWGGTGADGLAAFFYDASQDMAGALSGGSLGYCAGAGAYIGIGLDEYGNFSGPASPVNSACDNGANGVGATSQSVVIRGPEDAQYPMVATTQYGSRIDQFAGSERPPSTMVQVKLEPAGVGYNVTVTLIRSGVSTVLHNAVPFPYAPPTDVRLGFASSTGDRDNIHEVRNAVLAILAELDLSKTLLTPASAAPNSSISYTLSYFNRSAFDLPSGTVNFEDAVPAQITNPTWTCVGTACPSANGSGSIQAVNAGVFPANGQAVFTVTGTLSSAVVNGQVIAGLAKASFVADSIYAGPAKEASASITVVGAVAPQAVATPVPVLEGMGLVLLSAGAAGLGIYAKRRRPSGNKRS